MKACHSKAAIKAQFRKAGPHNDLPFGIKCREGDTGNEAETGNEATTGNEAATGNKTETGNENETQNKAKNKAENVIKGHLVELYSPLPTLGGVWEYD